MALIHPLIGGILAHASNMADSSVADDTSHLGATNRTPVLTRSDTTSFAACVEAPDRDGMIRFFAPRRVIHWIMARPIPPSPPATTYDAFTSNCQVLLCTRYFYFNVSKHVMLTEIFYVSE